jgi:SAM-dependent methyltransferase
MTDQKPWHEDDEFWEKAGPVLFHRPRLEQTPEEIDKILDLVDIRPGGKILDLCCGVGRHSLELARRGFQVTGVDRTASYLKKARGIAKKENLKVKFVQADMREFVQDEAFDLILNLYTSFGYFDDPADDRRAAENIYKSLKKGGRFLLESASKEINARIFRKRDWNELDGILILEEREVLNEWRKIKMRWIVINGDERHDLDLGLRLYSAVEIISLFTDCGFRACHAFGGLDGRPYDNEAIRLIFTAQK